MPRVEVPMTGRIEQMLELFETVSRLEDPVQLQKTFITRVKELQYAHGYMSLSVRGLPPGHFRITKKWLEEEKPPEWRDWWKDIGNLPVHKSGLLSEIISTPGPKLFHHLDVRNDLVLGNELARFKSMIAAPLFENGLALNWSFVFREDAEGFNLHDVENFTVRGNLLGGMVGRQVQARQLRDLNERLNAQLQEIASIQQSLLPERLPDYPGLSIATSYLTSNIAGGDYYDFFEMSGGRLGALVADVSGHGAGAATVVAMLHAILHDMPVKDRTPASMLTHANHQLMEKRFQTNFVTAFLGMFDDRSK
ncbi:MAG TPA: SpoIIE family protein phosphatase, partial [Phycisphaerales bacterium]|nr:SpoIIE family protein phosphatase [Phycisphaerales bacterium]